MGNKLGTKIQQRLSIASIIALLLSAFLPYLTAPAMAAGLTFTMVRFDRMKTSQATTGTVCAKPSSTATEAKVVVTFPTGYTLGAFGTFTVNNTSNPSWPADPTNGSSAATPWVSIAAPTGAGDISGQSVTFGSGDLTAGTWYCFNWTNSAAVAIKSSATADNTGTVKTQTSAPADIDTGNYATASVTNDQIAVTASVNSTFNFALSSNSAALGTLSTGGPSASSAINARVDTNAQKGWNIWAYDPAGTPGLTSTLASKTIAYSPSAGSAASALTAGNEGYNLGAASATGTCNGGTPTVDTNFFSNSTSFKGGGLDNTPRIVATGTGTASNCAVPLTVNASISGTTPAATDYAGTMTVVAAGRF